MSQLPNEILLSILKYCDYETIMAMSYANKNLNNLVHGNWRHFPKKHLDLVVIALTNADDVDIEYKRHSMLRKHRHRKLGGDKWQVIIAENDSDMASSSYNCDSALEILFSTKNAKITVDDPIKLLPELISFIQERCTVHELHLCEMTPKSLSAIADTLTNLPVFVLHVHFAQPKSDEEFSSAVDEIARIDKVSGALVVHMTCRYETTPWPPNDMVGHFATSLPPRNMRWIVALDNRIPSQFYSDEPENFFVCPHCSPEDQEAAVARSDSENPNFYKHPYAKSGYLEEEEDVESGSEL